MRSTQNINAYPPTLYFSLWQYLHSVGPLSCLSLDVNRSIINQQNFQFLLYTLHLPIPHVCHTFMRHHLVCQAKLLCTRCHTVLFDIPILAKSLRPSLFLTRETNVRLPIANSHGQVYERDNFNSATCL